MIHKYMVDDPASAEVHVNGMADLIAEHFDDWWNHPTGSKVRCGPADGYLPSICADRRQGRFVHLTTPRYVLKGAERFFGQVNTLGSTKRITVDLSEAYHVIFDLPKLANHSCCRVFPRKSTMMGGRAQNTASAE